MADLSQFKEAAAAVKHSPHAVSAWEEVEALAADLDKPDEIVALYNETLGGEIEPQVAEMIGERAGSFCDEWFGDDPTVLEKILIRVTALAPTSDTALQRLSVHLHRRRALDRRARRSTTARSSATKDKPRRIRLLREAAQLAKDVANQPDKAIGYYQQLLPLTPDDAQVSQGLERLLERHERWADLIELWEGRLESQSKKERERSRARIAVGLARQPRRSAARPRRDQAAARRGRRRQRERPRCSSGSSSLRHATRGVREAALDLLRSHYDADAAAARGDPRPRARDRARSRRAAARSTRRRARGSPSSTTCRPRWITTPRCSRWRPSRPRPRRSCASSPSAAAIHDRYADGRRRPPPAPPRIRPAGSSCSARPRARASSACTTSRPRSSCSSRPRRSTAPRSTSSSGRAPARRAVRADRAAEGAARACSSARPTSRPTRSRAARSSPRPPSSPSRSATPSARSRCGSAGSTAIRAILSGLDARIGILETQERWDDLVAALESRADKAPSPMQKRADLVRVALDPPPAARAISTPRSTRGSASSPITRTTRRASPPSPTCSPRPVGGARWPTCSRARRVARPAHRRAPRPPRRCAARAPRCSPPVRSPRIATRSRSMPTSKEARAGLTALLEVAATRARRRRCPRAGDADQRRPRRRARSPARAARRGQGRSDQARPAPRGRAAPPRAQARRGRRARRSREGVPARAARSADREPARLAREVDRRLPDRRVRLSRGDRRARRRRARGRAAAPRLRRPRRRSPRRSAGRRGCVRGRSPGSSPATAARSTRSRASARKLGRWDDAASRRRPPLPPCARRSTTSCCRSSRSPPPRRRPASRRARRRARHGARRAQAADRGRRAVPPPARDAPPRSPRRPGRRDRARCARPSSSAASAPRGSASSSRSSASRARRPSCSRRCAGSPTPMAAISTRSSAPPTSRRKLGDREQALAILSAVLGRATAAWRGTAVDQERRARSMPSRSGRSTPSSICTGPVAAPAPPSTR